MDREKSKDLLEIFGHPNAEERADRFVITGLQLHVTAVVKLFDVTPPPQNTVTPRRDSTLSTVTKQHSRKHFAISI